MREIKFRAWDRNNKRMLYQNKDFGYVGISFDGIPFIDLLKVDSIDKGTKPIWQTTVMQYTGLKDKNGKEIYEGDIIDFKGEKEVIYYDNNTSQFTLKSRWLWGALREGEVVGNIYENPELLERG